MDEQVALHARTVEVSVVVRLTVEADEHNAEELAREIVAGAVEGVTGTVVAMSAREVRDVQAW